MPMPVPPTVSTTDQQRPRSSHSSLRRKLPSQLLVSPSLATLLGHGRFKTCLLPSSVVGTGRLASTQALLVQHSFFVGSVGLRCRCSVAPWACGAGAVATRPEHGRARREREGKNGRKETARTNFDFRWSGSAGVKLSIGGFPHQDGSSDVMIKNEKRVNRFGTSKQVIDSLTPADISSGHLAAEDQRDAL
jgi:hypothetical protein